MAKDDETPVLRADATEDSPDEIWVPDIDPAKAEEAFHNAEKIEKEDLPVPPSKPAIVGKRQEAVVVNGVFHGMRDVEE